MGFLAQPYTKNFGQAILFGKHFDDFYFCTRNRSIRYLGIILHRFFTAKNTNFVYIVSWMENGGDGWNPHIFIASKAVDEMWHQFYYIISFWSSWQMCMMYLGFLRLSHKDTHTRTLFICIHMHKQTSSAHRSSQTLLWQSGWQEVYRMNWFIAAGRLGGKDRP